ncbi:MAG TPA: energy transducer TonB [Candidatus Acidoferrum sp.]
MNLSRRLLYSLLFVFSVLLPCDQAFAQFSKLDDLTAQIAKKLKDQKPNLVAVVRFTAPDGSPSLQGDYFAWFVATSLRYHAKKIRVTDPKALESALAKEGISLRDLDSAETLNKIAAQAHLDFIVTGTVETGPDSYTIHVTIKRLPGASQLIDKTTAIRRTEFTDSLSEPFPPKTDNPVVKISGLGAAVNMAAPPVCVYCPVPSYNDEARREKIQGTSLFEVLISSSGEVVKAHPTKLLGYGLDQQGFDAIKRWHFEPARLDGKPVPVVVIIEVTFQLY